MPIIGRILPLILFLFLSSGSAHPSAAEVQHLRLRLSHLFKNELAALGFGGLNIIIDTESPEYMGGVQIIDKNITITVGADILKTYSSAMLEFMVCHELGHHLGGPPYKTGTHYLDSKISTEGQSDYWAAQECLPKINKDPVGAAENFFKWLHQFLQPMDDQNYFYAIPVRGQIDRNFYDSEYLSLQCRLDTVEAGFEKKPRPQCWYK